MTHLDKAEEGVVLHTTLPKVFAGLPRRRLEPVRVLVVVLVPHSQHEVLPFEVDLRDTRPEVVANLRKHS